MIPLIELIGQAPIFHHYSVDDGLAGSNVYDAIQDQEGYLWFGTSMGLCRFDGYAFRNYSIAEGLPYNDIWFLHQDSNRRIWLSSLGTEFIYLDESGFHFIPYPKDNEPMNLSHYYREGKAGSIYFSNYRTTIFKLQADDLVQVFYQKNKKGQHGNLINPFINDEQLFSFLMPSYDGIDSSQIAAYYFDQNDSLQFHQHFHLPAQFKISHSNFIALNKDTLLFFEEGAVHIVSDHQVSTKHFDCTDWGRPSENYSVSYVKGEGYLINSPKDNIFLDLQFNCHSIASFLSPFQLNNLFKDQTGNLWVLTKDNGIFYLPKTGLRALNWNTKSGLSSNQVTALSQDHNGRIIAGTSDGNIYFLQNKQLIPLDIQDNDLSRGKVRSLAVNEAGVLFAVFDAFGLLICDLKQLDFNQPAINVNTYPKQLYLQSQKEFSLKSGVNHFPYGSPKSVAVGNKAIWLSTGSKGVIQISTNNKGAYQFNLTNHHRTYTSAPSKAEKLWIGQGDGLFLLQQGQWINLEKEKKEQPLLSLSIRDIQCDQNGIPWIATGSQGIYAFYDQKTYPIAETTDKVIKSIYIDQQNQIWATSNNGLLQINCKSYTPFEYELRYFTRAHGLASNEINCIVAKDTVAYIGSGHGLSKINLVPMVSQQKTFPLHITSINIQGKDTLVQDFYDLSPSQNSIRISFVGLSYESEGDIIYEYRMEGIDTSWQSTKNLQKEYLFLPYGKTYTFHLSAHNKEGLHSANQVRIQFKIRSPWWSKTGVHLLGILSIALLFYGIYIRRVKTIRQKATEKLEVSKRLATLKLQALQARMNPHFIFNALQAIQDFITNQDERTANKYLSNFSRLMRLFLDSSIEKYISLDQELELLQLYLELEQLRFDPPFSFHFDIPEKLDISTIEIPTMILQPFVENAVNHGLRYKSGAGTIKIIIREAEEKLKVIIEDNGVGRAKAKAIQQKSRRSYVSRSTKIVEERLSTIAILEEQQIKIEIQDLMEQESAKGTRVYLEIELND